MPRRLCDGIVDAGNEQYFEYGTAINDAQKDKGEDEREDGTKAESKALNNV